MSIRISLIALCATAFAVSSPLFGDEVKAEQPLVEGDRAPVSGVYFATGPWREVSKMTCPAAKYGNEPKLVIYTTELNEPVLNLAEKFEAIIASDESLKWSFVSVSDPKGGHRGVKGPDYYTDEERVARLAEIKEIVADRGMKNITVGITMAPAKRERAKLHLHDEHDMVVAYIGGKTSKSRMIRYIKPMHSSQLTEDVVKAIVAEIQTVHKK